MSGSLDNSRGAQLLTSKPSVKFSVLTLILCVFSLVIGSPVDAQTIVDGGLTASEVGWSLGSNRLVNGNFSQGTSGWTLPSNCFAIDPTTPAPNGAASLLMSDSATCANATPIAVNALKVSGGAVYTLSGQVKTENFVGTNSIAGAVIYLYDFARSPIFKGTTDWTTATVQHVSIPSGKTASLRLQTYDPVQNGSAWFANMS